MARIGLGLCLFVFLWSSPAVFAQSGVSSGIVTANNVDITTDTGEVLPERLHVGDSIYVVTNPGKVRKGWVRVSRSPDDTVGIGWIEEKNVRTYKKWGGGGAPAPVAPPSTPDTGDDLLDFSFDEGGFEGGESAMGEKKVAVLAFSGSDPGEPFLADARKHFLSTLEQNGDFDLNVGVDGKGVNSESEAALKQLLAKHKLDGAFVGSVSPPIGGARLVKVKFFSAQRGTFAVEKVKRVSSTANLSSDMAELVKSCVDEISTF